MTRTLVLTLLLAALSACGTTTPKPTVDYARDYDFTDVKTVAFYALSGQVTGDSPVGDLTDFQKQRINDALTRALGSKGLEVVDDAEKADLLLSWHVNTVEKQDIRKTSGPTFGMSYGYSRYNRYAMYSCYSCFDNTEVRVTDYTQGTFIVDMIDPEQKKSVWRSVTQSKLKGDGLKDQANIDAGALLILQGFPPGAATAN